MLYPNIIRKLYYLQTEVVKNKDLYYLYVIEYLDQVGLKLTLDNKQVPLCNINPKLITIYVQVFHLSASISLLYPVKLVNSWFVTEFLGIPYQTFIMIGLQLVSF